MRYNVNSANNGLVIASTRSLLNISFQRDAYWHVPPPNHIKYPIKCYQTLMYLVFYVCYKPCSLGLHLIMHSMLATYCAHLQVFHQQNLNYAMGVTASELYTDASSCIEHHSAPFLHTSRIMCVSIQRYQFQTIIRRSVLLSFD